VHGEGGQATVEWVALALVAALVLGAAAVLAGREADRGLGEEVAERISRTASGVGRAPAGAVAPPPAPRRPGPAAAPRRSAALVPAPPANAPRVSAPPAPATAPRVSAPPVSAPPASAPRAVDAFRSLRGVADVARHTWILCLGYRRWRYELEHPMAPTETLPLDEALSIVNTCFNPHDYLLEED
jgi:hypothetical protein